MVNSELVVSVNEKGGSDEWVSLADYNIISSKHVQID